MNILNPIQKIGENVTALIQENPLVALGTGTATGALIGGGVVGLVKSTRKKKSVTRRRKNAIRRRTKRGRSRDRKYISKQKHERAYVRRKKRAGKKITRPRYKTKSRFRRGKIHYARKTGQPYIILSDGRAKFIKGKRRK